MGEAAEVASTAGRKPEGWVEASDAAADARRYSEALAELAMAAWASDSPPQGVAAWLVVSDIATRLGRDAGAVSAYLDAEGV